MTTTRREFLAMVAMGVAIAAADPTQAMLAAGNDLTADDLLWGLELGDRVWLRFTAAPWQGKDTELFEVVRVADDAAGDRTLAFRAIDGSPFIEVTSPDGQTRRQQMDVQLQLNGANRR